MLGSSVHLNQIILVVFASFISLIFGGCQSNEPLKSTRQNTSAVQNRPALIRDSPQKIIGVYVAKWGVRSDYSVLRFYADGTVLYVEGQPLKPLIQDANQTAAQNSAYIYKGRYFYQKQKIAFSVKSSDFGSIEFKGEFKNNELHLKQSGNGYGDDNVASIKWRIFKLTKE